MTLLKAVLLAIGCIYAVPVVGWVANICRVIRAGKGKATMHPGHLFIFIASWSLLYYLS